LTSMTTPSRWLASGTSQRSLNSSSEARTAAMVGSWSCHWSALASTRVFLRRGDPIGLPSSRRRMLKEARQCLAPTKDQTALAGSCPGDRAATSGVNFKATPFMQ
jgi:hypothetical protein